MSGGVRQRAAPGGGRFSTDSTGPVGGTVGAVFGLGPQQRALTLADAFTSTGSGAPCDAGCQAIIEAYPDRGARALTNPLVNRASLGFVLTASSDGDMAGPATLDALSTLVIDGLAVLDGDGAVIPGFILSERRDYTLPEFAPERAAPIPVPATASLLIAGLALLTLLCRSARGGHARDAA